jgi:hypothetical protein
MKLIKVISGGQTGVDQAALQAAIDSDIKHGGWCPPARVCEIGKIPERYHLIETPDDRDLSALEIPRSQRTIWNVRDSDGVLVLWDKKVTELQSDKGTKLALETANNLGKPFLIIDVSKKVSVTVITNWISSTNIEVLNVAGPSENTSPGIYDRVYEVMQEILTNSD